MSELSSIFWMVYSRAESGILSAAAFSAAAFSAAALSAAALSAAAFSDSRNPPPKMPFPALLSMSLTKRAARLRSWNGVS